MIRKEKRMSFRVTIFRANSQQIVFLIISTHHHSPIDTSNSNNILRYETLHLFSSVILSRYHSIL